VIFDYGDGPIENGPLEWLGITVEQIHEVLAYGEAERRTYTAFDAKSVPEAARWSRHVRRASEIFVPLGWERIDPMGQPTLVTPDKSRWLLVASGDPSTGWARYNPTTKNPKGRTIREAVEANAQGAIAVEDIDPAWAGAKETWVLLTAPGLDTIRSEISFPEEMNGEFITKWTHRAIIPPFNKNQPPPLGRSQGRGPQENPPQYDVDVRRRQT
jgi:hypothetical protein